LQPHQQAVQHLRTCPPPPPCLPPELTETPALPLCPPSLPSPELTETPALPLCPPSSPPLS
jgi:hypothetical protein